MKVAAVLLDADGVAIHSWRFRDHLTKHHGITPEMTRPFFQGIFGRLSLGEGDLRDALAPYLPRWGWSGSVDEFLALWFEVDGAADERVLGAVDGLRAAGIPCALATNQERCRARYIARDMGFARRFDRLFFSCDLGVKKPAPGFFEAVTAELDLAPERILFFDDAPGNVETARACGWRAELYSDFQVLEARLAQLVSA